MLSLNNKRILVGVSGGIAAYKSPDLVRRLRERGADVRVVMTPNAIQFITPLTLQAVSGTPVHLQLLDAEAESGMGHIELARWADAIVIAPATANFIARLTHGTADDLLSTLCLATDARIAISPAMNRLMWDNAATQENLDALRQRGISVLGPGEGDQACGETGPGRMLEPDVIADQIGGLFENDALNGINMVITAGPTWEALDPVRVLTNHSSGKMGYAVSQAALEAGAAVTLISGPTALTPPERASVVRVESALQMYEAVHECIDKADVFIGVAAVADYRPAQYQDKKIKKQDDTLHLELVKNPDILASVAALTDKPFTVGFAAETNDMINHGRKKLVQKGVDLIAANRVGAENGGFGDDNNELTLIDRHGVRELASAPKTKLARQLIADIAKQIADQSDAKDTTQNTRQSSAR
ncbi:MAG: bifunctional phosphopantothenoylcysteine decarboxylase/phosphopantothenate--cysteine ligase CoaBC [Gammaproteobacteria bacterium]|nr:bifunctional phosphopantothenoylcysteine decarboxylase/phosphopantothenate--cysteine ligase CoaBC [Gammaproteobacteria bacterium]